MKMTPPLLVVVAAACLTTTLLAQDPTAAYQTRRRLPLASPAAPTAPAGHVNADEKAAPAGALPPLPEGVSELKFSEFYQMPIGPRGMEFTARLQNLNGKKVRILGYQVAEAVGVCNAESNANDPKRRARAMLEASVPGRLLLAATPQTVNLNHYGLCEDLPPALVFVTVPEMFGEILPQTPGLLLLTGTLEVGNKQEADGRISSVRLKLDPRTPAPTSQLSPQSSATVAANQDHKNTTTK